MSSADLWVRRALLAALLIGIIVVVALLTSGHSEQGHKVTVIVPDATYVLPGQAVRDSGVTVGHVDSIDPINRGHDAKIGLTIDDNVWPLTQGSKLQVRWGGTASFVNRYVNLTRGPSDAAAIATDGRLPASAFTVPVEFDQFTGTFTPAVRANLKSFLDNAGVDLKTASPGLRATIEKAPPALVQASAVLNDLTANSQALTELINDGSQVVHSVNAADPGVESLITNAATTFSAIADKTHQLESTLQDAPSVMATFRQTLKTATPTLNLAKSVTGKLAPGVKQIDEDATPLDGVLVTLKHVSPNAISALASARQTTPTLNPLLDKLTSLMPTFGSIGSQANTALDCIRPYTPDIVAFPSDWGDFLGGVSGKDHYFRAMVQSLIPAEDTVESYNSSQLAKMYPDTTYAYPTPPGYASGKPWLIGSCGEGSNTLIPADDPEQNTSAAELPPAPASDTADRK